MTRQTILHVDDDPYMLEMVAARLKPAGYDVIRLSDSSQLMETLVARDCRVVLLDVQMPDEDGLELLSRIKAHDGGIQVIMLTGIVSEKTVLEALRRGAEACFFKPLVDFSDFRATLDRSFAKIEQWQRTLSDYARRRAEPLELVISH